MNKLIEIFKNVPNFENLYLAGGAVRDHILGNVIKDFDFVVDGDIDAGLKFATEAAKVLNVYKKDSNPVTFPKYGTAKLHYNGIDYEFVAPRKEVYSEGSRKPEVFTTSLESDCYRRDLTINSLFYHVKSETILDFTGKGLEDIKNKTIRTPLDPNTTFSDDSLRMLRFVRFLFRYDGWSYEPEHYYAILKNTHKLKTISTERINDEFSKILLCEDTDSALKFLLVSGLLTYIVPELELCFLVRQNEHHKSCVFDHTVEVVSKTPKRLIARLGALFHDIGKPATKSINKGGDIHFYKHDMVGAAMTRLILQRLKYPNEIVDKVSKIVNNHMQLKFAGDNAKISDKALRKFVARNYDILDDLLDVMHADNISHKKESCMPNQIPLIREKIKSLGVKKEKSPKLPISGKDLMNLGLTPSPLFSKLLSIVEDEYYSNPNISKEDAIKLIKEKIKKI